MSAFEEEGESSLKDAAGETAEAQITMINLNEVVEVIYHPDSGIPCEFCEFSETFEKDLPWILENCPEAVSEDVLAKAVEKMTLKNGGDGETLAAAGGDSEEGGKKEKQRGAGIAAKKTKAGPGETKVIINRVQRQKRKFVTAIIGMETVPDIKMKDVAKFFGKKFASGSAISKIPGGGEEIVIQGDVQYDLPEILVQQYNVPPTCIWLQEKTTMTPYHG
jgi:density-regulated protein